jgi:hypothetical protein
LIDPNGRDGRGFADLVDGDDRNRAMIQPESNLNLNSLLPVQAPAAGFPFSMETIKQY